MGEPTDTRTHHFTLFLSGADVLGDENMNALYEAGCDDALFGERDGRQYAAFDREAPSFGVALASAIHGITLALPGVRVIRVEPDELVTMATIADRSGLSREYIRLLANRERGPGGFPSPVAYVDRKSRLWYWPDAAEWLIRHEKAKVDVDTEAAGLVAALNAALALREHTQRLHGEREVALVAEVLREPVGRLEDIAARLETPGAPAGTTDAYLAESRRESR